MYMGRFYDKWDFLGDKWRTLNNYKLFCYHSVPNCQNARCWRLHGQL